MVNTTVLATAAVSTWGDSAPQGNRGPEDAAARRPPTAPGGPGDLGRGIRSARPSPSSRKFLQGLAQPTCSSGSTTSPQSPAAATSAGRLAAWTKREGAIANVHKQLRPERRPERGRPPPPARGPRRGRRRRARAGPPPPFIQQLSRPWALWLILARHLLLIAIYARNLLINLLILLPATVFVVTLVRLALLFWCLRELLRGVEAA